MKTLLWGIGALFLALALSMSAQPSQLAAKEMPYTFFLTHYELLGDPNNPTGVRYHSNGQPFAKAPDGSSISLSGQGGWDPAGQQAEGGGQYIIKDAAGAVTAQGSWQVTGFTSFEQLDGWWGIPGFKEEGWQGSPGSASFPGFLNLKVNLEKLGDGDFGAWCIMSETPKLHNHQSDGISLTGGNFNFSDYSENEMGFEGVMFYSTGPASWGYVLDAQGAAVFKPAAAPEALPATGGDGPFVIVRALLLIVLGLGVMAAGLAVRRRWPKGETQ